jgi:hypothetical protein
MTVAFPVAAPHALAETTPTTVAAPTAPVVPPKPKPIYTYDSVTKRWNTQDWVYSSVTGTYQPVITTSTTPPAGMTTPTPESSSTTPTTSSSAPVTTPTSSTNTATTNTTTNAATTSTIGNSIGATSTTGNANVTSNTNAGNATTGTAAAATTLTNIVNSTTSGGVATPATFTSNINGNVNGDIVLYPMIMAAMLGAAGGTSTNTATSTNTQNLSNTTGITNNADLSATSGNATVANNTTAGSATSGNASAVGNIVNMINSAIAAGSSFIGTINIYGNLNGDILVSPGFVPSLIAANNTTNTVTANANLSDTQNITNNVKLGASTGTATVAGNTRAGSATTGDAKTNLVLLNLTGHQVVAKDSLLVFVNVLGTWVGLIVDAQPGATSAALGDDVTTNTTTATANLNASNEATITNNLTLNAASGDATVAHNTNAGNATTGNASASANILNVSQSNFGLSGWFGILFINVFGSWLGSFGVDTPNGNPPQVVSTSSDVPATQATSPAPPAANQAVQFIAHQLGTSSHHPLLGLSGNDDTPASPTPPAGMSQSGPAMPTSTTTIQYPTALRTTEQPRMPSNIISTSIIISTVFLAGIALRRIYADMVTISLLATS